MAKMHSKPPPLAQKGSSGKNIVTYNSTNIAVFAVKAAVLDLKGGDFE